MKILGVDSSATAASAAVLSDGKLLSVTFSNTGLTHSQTLLPMIDNTLNTAGLTVSDIDCFAVTNGPGSFTGVRIGVSAVKGLSQPLNKSCMAVSTLEAIAKPLENSGVYAVSVMDARCNQVYTAQFDCENGFSRATEDDALSIEVLAEQLNSIDKRKVLIGDGALLCYNKMKDVVKDIELAPLNIRYQSASSVALIAYDNYVKLGDSCFIDSNHLVPNYLRLSQAERELKKKQENEI